MDEITQKEILKLISSNVDKLGETSIKSVAESVSFAKVSLADQKKLAKLIVKNHPFVTEQVKGEIFVRKNSSYNPDAQFMSHESMIAWLIMALAGILIFIIFHLILPATLDTKH
ncbi:MAG TPA: hypothetical protein PL029_00875 [Bacteroidia bacterium]|nr:hypothetical protein [Bacteroidia bacterium]